MTATRNTVHNKQVDMTASYPSVTICRLNFSFNDRFYISAPSSVGPTVPFLPHLQILHGTLQIFTSALKIDLSRNSFNL